VFTGRRVAYTFRSMKRHYGLLAGVLLPGGLLAAPAARISEVNYHPAGAPAAEFVEITNSGDGPVDLAGWAFTEGVRFTFSSSRVLAPGDVVLIARSRASVELAYGVASSRIAGEYFGALDDDGDRITLVDGTGANVETLDFKDHFPFGESADGDGDSLHRACFDLPASAPFNWKASSPSPGATDLPETCPPQSPVEDPVARSIIIHEVSYHPAGNPEPPLEFIELMNRGAVEQDVSAWSFDKGVKLTFPAGTRIPSGGFIVAAQDPAALVLRFGLDPSRVFGPFEDGSKLSNSGERIRLVDAAGSTQDELTYVQDGAWPVLADGLGGSLQRVDPLAPTQSPGNWRCEPPPADQLPDGGWASFSIEAPHDGPRIYLYLLGAGEALIDDVSLEVKGGDGTKFITNGGFDAGAAGWSGTGNHVASAVQPAGGFSDDGPCLRIVATGDGDGFQNAVRQTLAVQPPDGVACVLRLRIKPVSGEARFIARSSIATKDNGLLYLSGDARTGQSSTPITPLAPNGVGGGPLPPTIDFEGVTPAWPSSKDPVDVRVRIVAAGVSAASVHYRVDLGEEIRLPLRDDGQEGDISARDGTWTGRIPPQRDGSLVWLRFEASTEDGAKSEWPRRGNPATVTGYYVEDDVPEQNEDLQLYYIFTPGALRDLSCADNAYVQGVLVDPTGRARTGVGVKFRGETACGYPKKPIRVEFQKGDLLHGQRHLNFNAGWNDKSMLREQFAFDFFRDAGCPYSETHLARVHTNNGAFHGAYFTVEDPASEYLQRNRLEGEGGLFKCRTAMLNGATTGYEPRTDESAADLPSVGEFATELNRRTGQPLVDFLVEKLDVESVDDYQAVQVIIIDGDSVVKNWLLYHGRSDLAPSAEPWRFSMFPWDVDLSYGQMLLTTDVRNYDIHPLFQTATYPFYDQGYHGILNALLQRSPNDYFVRSFYGRMWRLLEEKFNETVLFARLDRFEANTGATVREDLRAWPRSWGARGTDPDYWRQDFRKFVQERRNFLTRYLTALNPTTQGRNFQYVPAPTVKFSEINYHPADARDDLEFVELTSLEPTEVDVSGWSIPRIGYVFPPGSTLPAHGTLLVAKDPVALGNAYALGGAAVTGPYAGKLPRDGGLLKLVDSGGGGSYYPETIDRVAYGDGPPWPKAADGDGKSLELLGLTLDNDLASSWRAGWSPGADTPANRSPTAVASVELASGITPLSALLVGVLSSDPDGDDLTYEWSIPGAAGGAVTDHRPALLVRFDAPGQYAATLIVRDGRGGESRAETMATVVAAQEIFRRGDANDDDRVDISDAVETLGFLFLGDLSPACLDASDSDDDGQINVTDAIFLLSHLFAGGDPLPPPGPDVCGPDASADDLPECGGGDGCAG